MRINCVHGYYFFEETEAGQMSDFSDLFDLFPARSGDHFTFEGLVGAPRFSIEGGTFLGCPTTKTFEGEPWEVMRANGIVYDFINDQVVPIAGVLRSLRAKVSGNFYITSGIILAGSVMEDGKRVTDYAAFYEKNRAVFEYSEVVSV